MKKISQIIYIGILMMLLAACQADNMLPLDDEMGTVSYAVKLDNNVQGRAVAIGDGNYVDQLVVGVFQTRNNILTQISQFTYPVENGIAMINIPLMKKDSYDLVFWAQTKDNGVYNIDDLSNIIVNYHAFDKTLTESIALDAFYAIRKDVTVDAPGSASITLNRPFAQVSFGVCGNKAEVDKIKAAEIKINGLYTEFCPLNDSEVVKGNVSEPYVFKFKDLKDKDNTYVIDGKTYTHLTTNYFFAPVQDTDYKISGFGKLMDENNAIVSEFTFADVPLLPNVRVNVGKVMHVD